MVQSVKNKLRKLRSGNWRCRLARMLFALRTTPSAATGKSPAELLLNRRPRTLLDHIKPSTTVPQRDEAVHKTREQKFQIAYAVFVRNYSGRYKWVAVTVSGTDGNCSYEIKRCDGLVQTTYVNQLRKRIMPEQAPEASSDVLFPLPGECEAEEQQVVPSECANATPEHSDPATPSTTDVSQTELRTWRDLRQSARQRMPPDFYGAPIPF